MSDKKRKRDQDVDTPRKRVASNDLVKVQFVQEDGLGPVIASTTGCVPPKGVTFTPYYKRRDENERPEILLHSSSHPTLDYIATEETSGSADSLLKHYIGIYNPATSTLKVCEAPRVFIRSKLRPTQKELDEEAAKQAERQTNFAARQTLGMEFGTKKAKKALLSLTENAISPQKNRNAVGNDPPAKDAFTTAMLDAMAKTTAGMPTKEQRQAVVDEAKPRPQPHLEAEKPEDVYPLDTLIPEEVMMALYVKDWTDAAANNEAVKTHSRFVANRLHTLAVKGNTRKLKILRYILALIDFNAACSPTPKGGRRLPRERATLKSSLNVGDAVVGEIRRKFSEKGEMTKWHVDYMMTHICALALHADNFEVDTHDLREDLRLETVRMNQYFHELGCKVNPPTEKEKQRLKITKAEAGLHRIAKLRLPLDFPKERVGRRNIKN